MSYFGVNRKTTKNPLYTAGHAPGGTTASTVDPFSKKQANNKWLPFVNPIAQEAKEPVIRPPAHLAAKEKAAQYEAKLASATAEEKVAIYSQQHKGTDEAIEVDMNEKYRAKFSEFLRGVAPDKEYQKVGWDPKTFKEVQPGVRYGGRAKNEPLSLHPTVIAYLDSTVDSSINYQRDLAKLRNKAASTGMHNMSIDECWKLYKYYILGIDDSAPPDPLGFLGTTPASPPPPGPAPGVPAGPTLTPFAQTTGGGGGPAQTTTTTTTTPTPQPPPQGPNTQQLLDDQRTQMENEFKAKEQKRQQEEQEKKRQEDEAKQQRKQQKQQEQERKRQTDEKKRQNAEDMSRKQRQELVDQLAAHEVTNNKQRNEHAALQKQLLDLNKDVARHTQEKATLTQELKDLKKKHQQDVSKLSLLSVAEKGNEQLHQHAQHLQAQLDVLTQQHLFGEKQYLEQSRQFEKTLVESSLKDTTIQDLQQHIATAGEHNSRIQERLTTLESENEKYRAHLEFANQQFSTLQTQMVDAVGRLEQAGQEIYQWKSRAEHAEGEAQRLGQAIGEAQQQIYGVTQTNEQLQQAGNELAQKANAEVERLKRENEELRFANYYKNESEMSEATPGSDREVLKVAIAEEWKRLYKPPSEPVLDRTQYDPAGTSAWMDNYEGGLDYVSSQNPDLQNVKSAAKNESVSAVEKKYKKALAGINEIAGDKTTQEHMVALSKIPIAPEDLEIAQGKPVEARLILDRRALKTLNTLTAQPINKQAIADLSTEQISFIHQLITRRTYLHALAWVSDYVSRYNSKRANTGVYDSSASSSTSAPTSAPSRQHALAGEKMAGRSIKNLLNS